METIFDHNPTEKELENIGRLDFEKNEYIDLLQESDTIYADLYCLFSIRGQKKKAEQYANKIQDKKFKFCTTYHDLINL